MSRTVSIYIISVVLFGIGLFCVMRVGGALPKNLPAPQSNVQSIKPKTEIAAAPARPQSGNSSLTAGILENLHHPLSLLLLQCIVMLAATRSAGNLMRKLGQPPVIGEMIAGILLGPSLLGMLSPATLQFLFPSKSLDALRMLSQLGVILFMFVVGMELEIRQLRAEAERAVVISHVCIMFSFLLGTTMALALYRPLAPADVSFHAFALFLGIAVSITAFPVLARIIEERGLSNTFLGITAITCAAIEDVTAWCMLALVLAVARAQALITAALPTALTLIFIVFMFNVVRPRMERILGLHPDKPLQEGRVISIAILLLLASAWFTETTGIHALFGAFLAGVILPRDERLHVLLREKLVFFSTAFLLPLFFASTGLRTQVGLLNDPLSWFYAIVIILVAVAGKLGGGMLAARLTGLTWSDAYALGSLMNTRGLMELIVLNIGYDMGILSPSIFAMMVLMALATTFMTSPLLSLGNYWQRRHSLPEKQATSVI